MSQEVLPNQGPVLISAVKCDLYVHIPWKQQCSIKEWNSETLRYGFFAVKT